MRIMFIDPGVSGTGWAFWEDAPGLVKYLDGMGHSYRFVPAKARDIDCIIQCPPIYTGTVSPLTVWKRRGWEAVAFHIADAIKEKIIRHQVEYLGIENPELWSGSATSQASASKGNLAKLSFLVGCIAKTYYNITGNIPHLFTPRSWKGQLPKDVVIKRIKSYWPQLSPRNHEADAVGMGLHFLGGI